MLISSSSSRRRRRELVVHVTNKLTAGLSKELNVHIYIMLVIENVIVISNTNFNAT